MTRHGSMTFGLRRAALLVAWLLACLLASQRALPAAERPEWNANRQFRILLTVDPRRNQRSYSPAAVEVDFQSLLGLGRTLDENSLQVIAYDDSGHPLDYDQAAPLSQQWIVPHRLDRLFGSTKAALNFVMRNERHTRFAVYFDAVGAERTPPPRYPGSVGDGDRFRQMYGRRNIAASHFDQFVDFDGDGDLDLFQGGVEPYVYCYENVGGNRLVERGRLANGGRLFTLPCSRANRSWLTVAFYDVDGDGDQDFLPSFGDGPDAGQIVLYRNTTERKGGELSFTRVGPLRTTSGVALAGGPQAGGWFPSIVLLKDWDGESSGRLDALVGSNNRCWLYRGAGTHVDGSPRFAEPVALQAGGAEINLVNPRFDCADIDADGDLDLMAGTQPGPIWYFENVGSRAKPSLAAGRIVALDGKYLIGDAHSGVKVADFDGDGRVDLVVGRFWQRTDLKYPALPRNFAGLYRNDGTRGAPRFVDVTRGAPFTEQFQTCDAARQNCVRATDWDGDGKIDLLAGDTDGFIGVSYNISSRLTPLFRPAKKLLADGKPLCVADSGGHARLDVCDWNGDGKRDLLVADGSGTLTLFEGSGSAGKPALAAGRKVSADGNAIQLGGRASVLVCDWDNDGRKDVVMADDKGYYWFRNVGTGEEPTLAAPQPIAFSGQGVKYSRPNLGALVDWDGDRRRDLIGCNFENNVRWYRNIGSRGLGAEPQFKDPEGVVILQGSSPQMISGANVIDWNGDGDLDILTGQGHGGSGLRFFERDWIEDELDGTHPLVTVGRLETMPKP